MSNFKVIDMKTLYFHINLLLYKKVINKIEAKINVYYVNNLKSTVQFTLKNQL